MAIIKEVRAQYAGKWYYYLVMIHHPQSLFRQRWDTILILVLLYNVFVIPFRLGFEPDVQDKTMDGIDIFVDTFFMADVALNFRTAYYDKGRLVIDRHKVAKNYLRGGFLLDFFTSLPYDAIVSVIGGGLNLARFLSLPKLLRLTRLARLMKVKALPPSTDITTYCLCCYHILDEITMYNLPYHGRLPHSIFDQVFRFMRLVKAISAWEDEADLNFSRTLRILKLFLFLLSLSHIAGCMFMFVAVSERVDGQFLEDSWVNAIQPGESSMMARYLVSLYWATTT